MNIKKLLTDAAAIVDEADIQGMSAQVTVVDGGLRLTVRKANDKIGYWIDGTFMPEAIEAEEGSEDDIPFH